MYEPPYEGLDGMLRGLICSSSQTRDPFITKQVTRYLFSEDPPHKVGEDLMSLNMQRGRDHGIPGKIRVIRVFPVTTIFVIKPCDHLLLGNKYVNRVLTVFQVTTSSSWSSR